LDAGHDGEGLCGAVGADRRTCRKGSWLWPGGLQSEGSRPDEFGAKHAEVGRIVSELLTARPLLDHLHGRATHEAHSEPLHETIPLISIRPFRESDLTAVRELFILVNRMLAPPHLQEGFESYISRSLREEIDRIPSYYQERQAAFGSR